MSRYLTRMTKYAYLRKARGKAAADRYIESCFSYDAMRVVGIKGTSAWIIRQEQLRKRREKRMAKTKAVVQGEQEKRSTWRTLLNWAILIFLLVKCPWLALGFLIFLGIK